MKNIVSTIIVFGSIFIMIVAGAFIFDKFNGFGLIDNVDSSLNSGIKKVLENEGENIAVNKTEKEEKNIVENNYIKDNISDNTSDNISDNLTITANDNVSNSDNQSDNITVDNQTMDNKRIINDNQTIDNNTPSDNMTDGIYI